MTESFYRPFELKCFRKVQKVSRKELFRRYTRPKIHKRRKRVKTLDSADFTNDDQKQSQPIPAAPTSPSQKKQLSSQFDILCNDPNSAYNGSYMKQHILLQSPTLPRESKQTYCDIYDNYCLNELRNRVKFGDEYCYSIPLTPTGKLKKRYKSYNSVTKRNNVKNNSNSNCSNNKKSNTKFTPRSKSSPPFQSKNMKLKRRQNVSQQINSMQNINKFHNITSNNNDSQPRSKVPQPALEALTNFNHNQQEKIDNGKDVDLQQYMMDVKMKEINGNIDDIDAMLPSNRLLHSMTESPFKNDKKVEFDVNGSIANQNQNNHSHAHYHDLLQTHCYVPQSASEPLPNDNIPTFEIACQTNEMSRDPINYKQNSPNQGERNAKNKKKRKTKRIRDTINGLPPTNCNNDYNYQTAVMESVASYNRVYDLLSDSFFIDNKSCFQNPQSLTSTHTTSTQNFDPKERYNHVAHPMPSKIPDNSQDKENDPLIDKINDLLHLHQWHMQQNQHVCSASFRTKHNRNTKRKKKDGRPIWVPNGDNSKNTTNIKLKKALKKSAKPVKVNYDQLARRLSQHRQQQREYLEHLADNFQLNHQQGFVSSGYDTSGKNLNNSKSRSRTPNRIQRSTKLHANTSFKHVKCKTPTQRTKTQLPTSAYKWSRPKNNQSKTAHTSRNQSASRRQNQTKNNQLKQCTKKSILSAINARRKRTNSSKNPSAMQARPLSQRRVVPPIVRQTIVHSIATSRNVVPKDPCLSNKVTNEIRLQMLHCMKNEIKQLYINHRKMINKIDHRYYITENKFRYLLHSIMISKDIKSKTLATKIKRRGIESIRYIKNCDNNCVNDVNSENNCKENSYAQVYADNQKKITNGLEFRLSVLYHLRNQLKLQQIFLRWKYASNQSYLRWKLIQNLKNTQNELIQRYIFEQWCVFTSNRQLTQKKGENLKQTIEFRICKRYLLQWYYLNKKLQIIYYNEELFVSKQNYKYKQLLFNVWKFVYLHKQYFKYIRACALRFRLRIVFKYWYLNVYKMKRIALSLSNASKMNLGFLKLDKNGIIKNKHLRFNKLILQSWNEQIENTKTKLHHKIGKRAGKIPFTHCYNFGESNTKLNSNFFDLNTNFETKREMIQNRKKIVRNKLEQIKHTPKIRKSQSLPHAQFLTQKKAASTAYIQNSCFDKQHNSQCSTNQSMTHNHNSKIVSDKIHLKVVKTNGTTHELLNQLASSFSNQTLIFQFWRLWISQTRNKLLAKWINNRIPLLYKHHGFSQWYNVTYHYHKSLAIAKHKGNRRNKCKLFYVWYQYSQTMKFLQIKIALKIQPLCLQRRMFDKWKKWIQEHRYLKLQISKFVEQRNLTLKYKYFYIFINYYEFHIFSKQIIAKMEKRRRMFYWQTWKQQYYNRILLKSIFNLSQKFWNYHRKQLRFTIDNLQLYCTTN